MRSVRSHPDALAGNRLNKIGPPSSSFLQLSRCRCADACIPADPGLAGDWTSTFRYRPREPTFWVRPVYASQPHLNGRPQSGSRRRGVNVGLWVVQNAPDNRLLIERSKAEHSERTVDTGFNVTCRLANIECSKDRTRSRRTRAAFVGKAAQCIAGGLHFRNPGI